MVAYMQLMDQPEVTVEQAPEPLLPSDAATQDEEATVITEAAETDASVESESAEVTDEAVDDEAESKAEVDEISGSTESDESEAESQDDAQASEETDKPKA